MPRTKIVCTLGPSSSDEASIRTLVEAGMDVARLNFSHGTHEVHAKNVATVRALAEEAKRPIAVLQDLQGPKIRSGKLLGEGARLSPGQRITLRYGLEQTDAAVIPIDYQELAEDTSVGSRILMDDGLLAMKVTGIQGAEVLCEVVHGGLLKSRKGINFPDNPLSIPSMTEKDTRDLLFGVSQGVDFVALSFVRQASDVTKLRQMLRALGADIPIVSKVEMLSAVQNIDEICQVSDAIMVARGDLGVECGFANVSAYQKKIVSAARAHGKPVIVATQMLDSMIDNRLPTKAEICDVANAVFDLADATMLSGESASGRHPALVVRTMRDILDRVDHSGRLRTEMPKECADVGSGASVSPDASTGAIPGFDAPDAFAAVAVDLARRMRASAIVCLTLTGHVARCIAKHRPHTPIVAISPRPDVVRKLALVRGVLGFQNPLFYDSDKALSQVGRLLGMHGLVKEGDLIVVTGGLPVARMAPTNLIKLHRISAADLAPEQ